MGITKRYLSILLTLVFIITFVGTACAPSQSPVSEAPEKTIKIGLQLCLTGPIACNGMPVTTGILDYLRYVNDDLGGIKYKYPVTGEMDYVKMELM